MRMMTLPPATNIERRMEETSSILLAMVRHGWSKLILLLLSNRALEGGKDVRNVEVGLSIRLSVSVIILIYFFR